MAWRKWLVRGGSFSALGLIALGGLAWVFTTQPEVVRQVVQEGLAERFVHVTVSVQAAHARLLGGIDVQEVRLSRNDGLDRTDFLYASAMRIYHDKEKLFSGEVGIRKVELDRPQLRIIRDRNGRVNVDGILGPTDLSVSLPTLVLHQGTIVIEDQLAVTGAPVLVVKEAQITVINDPLPTLQIEGTGRTDVLGPIKIHATIDRATFAARARIEVPDVPIGPGLVQRLAGFSPDLANHLRLCEGRGSIDLNLVRDPTAPQPIHYEATALVREGSLSHARLPERLDHIEAEARCVNGVVSTARVTARCGGARVQVSLEDLAVPEDHKKSELELVDVVRKLDARVEHLHVTEDLLKRLPPSLKWIEEEYAPRGPVSLNFSFQRPGPGPLVEHWLVQLEGVKGVCAEFPYPMEQVTGTVAVDASVSPRRHIDIDLRGRAGPCPVRALGKIRGHKEGTGVDVEVTGQGLVLDDKVMAALPKGAAEVADQFLSQESRHRGLAAQPMGLADFHTRIYRPDGQKKFQNVFTVHVRQASLRYKQFPYPLDDVSGTLVLYPDHWECHKFRGTRNGGTVFLEGRSVRVLPPPTLLQTVANRTLTPPVVPAAFPTALSPLEGEGGGAPTAPLQVRLNIRGKGVKLDKELESALIPLGTALQNTWQTLALSGCMDFVAEVIDNPGQIQDIHVGVDIQGCSMKPTFFAYDLNEVSASVRYARNKVYLGNIKARHGPADLGIRWGLIDLKPGGGYRAWLKGIEGKGLVPDADLLVALPEQLRKGLEPLSLHDPLKVSTELTIDAGPGTNSLLKVWWDGRAVLSNAQLRTGVDAKEVTGEVSCRGHHDGLRLRGLSGNLVCDRAVLLNQPLSKVSARVEINADTPEVLRIRHLKADAFGGSICGEALLRLGPVFSYEVWLEALQIQLDQFGKHNLGAEAAKAQLSGPARAALLLTGEGTDLLGLKGSGRVDVDNGKMGQLPLLLDLVKAFGLRIPDRTAFEQGHMVYGIEGPRIQVQQLDLYGNAISLHGQGTVDLDGNNLNLDFSATPGRVTQVLPLGMDAIPQAISEQILKIKMRGNLGKAGGVRFDKDLVPGVMSPIKRAIGAR